MKKLLDDLKINLVLDVGANTGQYASDLLLSDTRERFVRSSQSSVVSSAWKLSSAAIRGGAGGSLPSATRPPR